VKYIILEGPQGQRLPVIFPNVLVHKDVAEGVIRAVGRQPPEGRWFKPVTAGFVNLAVSDAYGESETLNMKSDPGDRVRINVADYSGGIQSPMDEMTERLLMSKVLKDMLDNLK
jgi:hypothetical protein